MSEHVHAATCYVYSALGAQASCSCGRVLAIASVNEGDTYGDVQERLLAVLGG
mgnify:FL=1